MSLRVQILSDIHVEFMKDGGKAFINSLDSSHVDVLIVAGDLANAATVENAIRLLCEKYKHVVYVAGNHSFYGGDPVSVTDRLEDCVKRYSNFHFLDESTVTIDGQRFVGTTLWFPDGPLNAINARGMNDFSEIKNFVPWVYKKNKAAVKFLNEIVTKDDIVVTHHLPSSQCTPVRFRGSPLDPFFICNMEKLIMQKKPKIWIHGHTHDSVDMNIGDTRIICNPYGYDDYQTNPCFKKNFVITV